VSAAAFLAASFDLDQNLLLFFSPRLIILSEFKVSQALILTKISGELIVY